jgi:hypothetical protein
MKTVIGLAGVKTSGKSTVANIIKDIMGGRVQIVESALADKLKDTCAEVFNLERVQFDAQDLKETPFQTPKMLTLNHIFLILEKFNLTITKEEAAQRYSEIVDMELESPRRIAQVVGTEVLRAAGDEDIHCKNIKLSEDGITIVSDLRFPNEFNYFNDNPNIKFLPLYIQRDEAEKFVAKDSHPSETSVFLFNNQCVKINNNNTLETLNLEIAAALLDSDVFSIASNQA